MSGKSSKQLRKNGNGLSPGNHIGISETQGTTLIGHVTKVEERHIAGPLPPPEILLQYKKIIPDAPERLLALVEKEQAHRHENENKMTEAVVADSKAARAADTRGDIIAIVTFIACMALGLFILIQGYSEVIAGSLVGAPLISSIGAFIFKRKKSQASSAGDNQSRTPM